jgi:hypothetical protein
VQADSGEANLRILRPESCTFQSATHFSSQGEFSKLSPQSVSKFIEIVRCDIDGHFWNRSAGPRPEFIGPCHTGGSQASRCCPRDVTGMRSCRNHHALAWWKIKRLSRSKIDTRLWFVVASNFSAENRVKTQVV